MRAIKLQHFRTGNLAYVIGEDNYGYNRTLFELEEQPESPTVVVKKGKTLSALETYEYCTSEEPPLKLPDEIGEQMFLLSAQRDSRQTVNNIKIYKWLVARNNEPSLGDVRVKVASITVEAYMHDEIKKIKENTIALIDDLGSPLSPASFPDMVSGLKGWYDFVNVVTKPVELVDYLIQSHAEDAIDHAMSGEKHGSGNAVDAGKNLAEQYAKLFEMDAIGYKWRYTLQTQTYDHYRLLGLVEVGSGYEWDDLSTATKEYKPASQTKYLVPSEAAIDATKALRAEISKIQLPPGGKLWLR